MEPSVASSRGRTSLAPSDENISWIGHALTGRVSARKAIASDYGASLYGRPPLLVGI